MKQYEARAHTHVVHILVAQTTWQRLEIVLITNNQPCSLYSRNFSPIKSFNSKTLARPLWTMVQYQHWYASAHTHIHISWCTQYKHIHANNIAPVLTPTFIGRKTSDQKRNETVYYWDVSEICRMFESAQMQRRKKVCVFCVFRLCYYEFICATQYTVQCSVSTQYTHISYLPTLTLSHISQLRTQLLFHFYKYKICEQCFVNALNAYICT